MTPTMNLATLCGGRTLLMRPDRLLELNAAAAQASAAGIKPEPETDTAPGRGLLWAMGGRPRKSSSASGKQAVAVVPVSGVIDQKMSLMMAWFGGTSTDALGETVKSLVADPDIKGIILDCDSPGGTTAGLREVSQIIYDARSVKPIVSISNSSMNSACFWFASAASKVFVAPGSMTGSVGVWTAFAEYTKQYENDGVAVKVMRSTGSPFKAELLPFEAWSAEAIDHEQKELDRLYDDFAAACAKHRNVSVAKVRSDFGQGRTMDAKSAVACGMADKVATLDQVIARMLSGHLSMNSMNGDAAALDGAFAEDVPTEQIDDSWKDVNESERTLSRLRRKGLVARAATP